MRAPWDAVFRLRRAGQIEDALIAFEQEWPQTEDDPSTARRALRASLQGELARVALERDHREEAVALLEGAIREAPTYPDLHFRLGQIERQRGNAQESRQYFERARELADHFADPVIALALSDAQSGRLGDAVRDVEAFAAMRPPTDRESFRRGLESLKSGSWEDAEPWLERAYGSREEAVEVLRREVAACLDKERLGEALEISHSLVEQLPGSAETHHTLGITYLALDWLDDAEESFGRALRINPDYHEARIYLAWVLYGRGESMRAESELNTLLGAVPNHGPAQRLAATRGASEGGRASESAAA